MFDKTIKGDPDKPICPLVRQPCLKHGCTFYSHVRGKHPQTGEDVDQWDCSINLLPMLLIQNANESRKTAAAVESCRNEISETSERSRLATIRASESFNQSSKDLILSLASVTASQKRITE